MSIAKRHADKARELDRSDHERYDRVLDQLTGSDSGISDVWIYPDPLGEHFLRVNIHGYSYMQRVRYKEIL